MSTRGNKENREPCIEHGRRDRKSKDIRSRRMTRRHDSYRSKLTISLERGITRQETKFDRVVGKIDTEIESEAINIIMNPLEVEIKSPESGDNG